MPLSSPIGKFSLKNIDEECVVMQEMVLYLTENLEALESVKNGQSNLLGVSVEEQRAILKSFEGNEEKFYYWA